MPLSQFTFYFFIATLIQISLLVFMNKKGTGTRYLYLLVIFFIAQNALYLVSFFVPADNTITFEILVRLFYALSFVSTACFLSYALEISVSQQSSFTQQIENGIWIVSLCGAILVVFSNEIITGYRPLAFTVSAIDGEYLWVRKTSGILAMLTASTVLFSEWKNSLGKAKKKHCLYLLIAYLAITLFATLTTIAANYGMKISFSAAFPFSTSFTLCLIVYGGYKYGWLTEQKTVLKKQEMSDTDQLIDIFNGYAEGCASFSEATEKIDQLLVSHSYNKYNGNIMKAAKAMGLGRSTLYKKVQKHKLR